MNSAHTPSLGQSRTTPAPAPPPQPVAPISLSGPYEGWEVDDYDPLISDGPSARKLVSSAVAPLVAAARGVRTLDLDDLRGARARYKLPDGRTHQARRLKEALEAGDVMLMPWYLYADVAATQPSAGSPVIAAMQYRPAHPGVDDNGREIKYEFVSAASTIIGIHPATPVDWMRTRSAVHLAEGQLKADSLLTAQLLAAGVPHDDLLLTDADRTDLEGDGGHGVDIDACRRRLTALMQGITDPTQQIPILCVPGVWNWRNNPEWAEMDLRDREVWVAFDGDVATNPQVHQAATQLWTFLSTNKRAHPRLLTPRVDPGASSTAPPEGLAKMGVDDFLATWGNYHDLMQLVSTDLPPAPVIDDLDKIGTVRVSADGTTVEACERREDGQGQIIGVEWVPTVPIGGRVISFTVTREPTEQERRTGIYQSLSEGGGDAAVVEVEVEVMWRRPRDGAKLSAVVRGPASLLATPPDKWVDRVTNPPVSWLMNEEWPPLGQAGVDWRKAIRANRDEEVIERVRWSQMGWVPVRSGGVPAFIVGDQVVADDEQRDEVISGIDEATLAGAAKFGMGPDDDRDYATDQTYRAELADNLRTLIDVLLSGAWTERGMAAAVLAAGLRPALPIRPSTTLFMVGPPASGKSWSAGVVCGFWSRTPGVWDEKSLPGSAKDTFGATESAVGHSVLWVADDLAPSQDRRKADSEQSSVEAIIRNVFNGVGKRRSSPSGKQGYMVTPRALLLVTAENESGVQSIRERSIQLAFEKDKSLDPRRERTQEVYNLYTRDGVPAKVTLGFVKFLRAQAKFYDELNRRNGDPRSGWGMLVQRMESLKRAHVGFMLRIMEEKLPRSATAGDRTRSAENGAELSMVLTMLAEMADDLEVGAEYADRIGNLSELVSDLASVIAAGVEANAETLTGRSVIRAISAALRAGKAHIRSIDDPSQPPVENSLQASELGWQQVSGQWRPMGSSIGVYIPNAAKGEPYVLLDTENAFKTAQSNYPEFLPYGQRPRQSWKAAASEGLLYTGASRNTSCSGSNTNTARVMVDGIRMSGYPVLVDVLVRAGEKVSEAATEAAAGQATATDSA